MVVDTITILKFQKGWPAIDGAGMASDIDS